MKDSTTIQKFTALSIFTTKNINSDTKVHNFKEFILIIPTHYNVTLTILMALNSLSADNKNKTIFKYCSQFLLAVGIRVSAISISTGMGISAIGSIRISTVGIGGISLDITV